MKQLLINFQLKQVILIIVLTAFAIKQFITLIDWSKKRTREAIEEKDKPIENIQRQQEQIENIKESLSEMKKQVKLLIRSDRDVIKHSITKDHHYFCYKLKSIDDYSLDCIERQYENYKEQGGNSFIKQLMEELRALPRKIEKDHR